MISGIVIKETGSNIISFLWGILSLCFDHLPQASSELDLSTAEERSVLRKDMADENHI